MVDNNIPSTMLPIPTVTASFSFVCGCIIVTHLCMPNAFVDVKNKFCNCSLSVEVYGGK